MNDRPDFQAVFESSPNAQLIVRADEPAYTIVACNAAYARLGGVSPAAIAGRSVFEVFPGKAGASGEESRRRLADSFRQAVMTRSLYVLPLIRYDVAVEAGFEARYWRASNAPLLDGAGAVELILHTVEEVTEKIRAQQLLESSEARFHQLAETTGFGLVIASIDGGLSYLNPTVMELLGYTAEDVAEGRARWDTITPPEYMARDEEAWREILITGKCAPFEKAYVTKDGRRVPVLIAASLLEARGGRPEVAAIVMDLRERKANERHAFLVRLDDAIRLLPEPDSIVGTGLAMLSETLQASGCVYWLFGEGGRGGWGHVRGSGEPLGQEWISAMGVRAEERLQGEGAAQEGGWTLVPLLKGGRLVAALGLTGLAWSAEELELTQTVASRCWETLERARITRELRASGERLRLAQKAGRIGSFEWLMKEGKIIWSPELEALYGLPEGSFEGGLNNWSERVVREDAERILREIQQCLAERGEGYVYDFRVMMPEGSQKWLRGQSRFFYDEQGNPERMTGVNIDIDEQKRAEATLKQQWHTFDTVLSNSPDALYIFDLEGRFRYANRALLSRLGMTLDELLGKTGGEVGYDPAVVDHIQGQIRRVIAEKQTVRDAMPFRMPETGSRHFEYILVPVLSAEGEVEAVAGSTRDITDRVEAEGRERGRQEQLLETARLESLGIMAGGIAHDFNNLLTGILGNASLLTEFLEGRDREVAGEIVLASERAAELTGQMLAYSGKGHFMVEVFNLNKLIEENLTLLRASLARNVSVELRLSEGACAIEGDRAQIQQVVMNLMINASEAIGEVPGRVTVRTGTREGWKVLEVEDTGSGIAPETVKRIFDPFFTTKFTGRGLGLAAVMGIVKGHRGEISVESVVGRGTKFRILLPAAGVEEKVVERVGPVPVERVSGQTVLLADDEEFVRSMGRAVLEAHGYRVVTAGNGAEALAVLREERGVSLVILDLTMPVMTGEQAVPLIREMMPGLPILLSSGFGEAEISRRFAGSGLAGFLQKPYTVGVLLGKVAGAIGRELAADG